jgi:hypothetical protein
MEKNLLLKNNPIITITVFTAETSNRRENGISIGINFELILKKNATERNICK